MALSPFQRDIGSEQGRISTTDAPAGSYVFELGSSAREGGIFNVGDYVEVRQTAIDFDGQASLVRVAARVELPDVFPTSPAWFWELTVRLNGSARYTRKFRPGPRELALEDVAVPTVARAAGPNNTLAVRLALVT